jgi:hypothetical protein
VPEVSDMRPTFMDMDRREVLQQQLISDFEEVDQNGNFVDERLPEMNER